MRRWKPQRSLGLLIALVLLIAAVLGAFFIGRTLATDLGGAPETWPIDLALYGRALAFLALVLLAGILAFRVLVALTMRYELDRNGLYIRWLGNSSVVPLGQILHLDLGVRADRMSWRWVQGIGVEWGTGRALGKDVQLFATQPVHECLTVHTPDTIYAISPADRESFVQELEQRRNLGATKSLAPAVAPARLTGYQFWSDKTVRRLLLVALGINLVILGLIATRYPALASTIEMRFDAAGATSELRPRYHVLLLPGAALALTMFNTGMGVLLYRSQQLGARLLQGASIIVQLLFLIATTAIVV